MQISLQPNFYTLRLELADEASGTLWCDILNHHLFHDDGCDLTFIGTHVVVDEVKSHAYL